MACPAQGPDNNPEVWWVVARREDGPGGWFVYYVGGVVGWVDELPAATWWPTREWADAVAKIFPGAVVVRVLLWEPLTPTLHLGDLTEAVYGTGI